MTSNEKAEKRAIDLVVSRFFAAFTNKGRQSAELDGLDDLFVPGCVIVKTCGTSPRVYGLFDFIAPRRRLLNEGELVDFSEEEIWENTNIFGGIAQRFCSYRKSGVLSGERFETKGMKTIQLVNTEAGWKISSVAWDDERDGVVVPSRYSAA